MTELESAALQGKMLLLLYGCIMFMPLLTEQPISLPRKGWFRCKGYSFDLMLLDNVSKSSSGRSSAIDFPEDICKTTALIKSTHLDQGRRLMRRWGSSVVVFFLVAPVVFASGPTVGCTGASCSLALCAAFSVVRDPEFVRVGPRYTLALAGERFGSIS